jgi:hypothetical protein
MAALQFARHARIAAPLSLGEGAPVGLPSPPDAEWLPDALTVAVAQPDGAGKGEVVCVPLPVPLPVPPPPAPAAEGVGGRACRCRSPCWTPRWWR